MEVEVAGAWLSFCLEESVRVKAFQRAQPVPGLIGLYSKLDLYEKPMSGGSSSL